MVFKQVMNTIWIVENFVKEPSFKGLTEAAKKLGVPLIEINGDYSPNIFVDKLKLRLIKKTSSPKCLPLLRMITPNTLKRFEIEPFNGSYLYMNHD